MTLSNTNPSAPGRNFSTKPKQNSSHEQASWPWNVNHPETATTRARQNFRSSVCVHSERITAQYGGEFYLECKNMKVQNRSKKRRPKRARRAIGDAKLKAEHIKQGSFIGKSKGGQGQGCSVMRETPELGYPVSTPWFTDWRHGWLQACSIREAPELGYPVSNETHGAGGGGGGY